MSYGPTNFIHSPDGDDDNGQQWVDSVYQAMDWERRIGQLFMARAHSDLGEEHIEGVKKAITENHVGGLCFFQGTPIKQAKLTNQYQSIAQLPLMIAVDAEWGIGMRFLDDAINYPKQLTLGAMQDNARIYQMGRDIGRQMKALGMHVNFAPVADVNNNPMNPVIHYRSFGENRYNVAAKCYQYMKGLQDVGIMACAKHFPGHGDTDVDSHYDLPIIRHSMDRLDSIELYPFRVLIDQGVQSMMVAHLSIPALDTAKNVASTLSKNTVTDLLIERLGFEGLIFTDALEMKGVTKHYGPGEVALRAFQAGNDVLVLPDDLDDAYDRMKLALDNGEITEDAIEQRVKKILLAKYDLGLSNLKPIDMSNIIGVAKNNRTVALKQELFEDALTVVANERNLIPLAGISQQKFATFSIGSKTKTDFQKRLDQYLTAQHFQVTHDNFGRSIKKIEKELSEYDVIVIGIHDMSSRASKDFGLSQEEIAWLDNFAQKKSLITVVFGSPYSLKFFEQHEHLIQAYEDDPMMQDAAAQGIMGVFSMNGKLPVTASEKFKYFDGLTTHGLKRLGYSVPERVGMSSDTLAQIETLVAEMIEKKAIPGCQILVVKEGKIVYDEAFGHHTYDKKKTVKKDDIYDVASVTKIAATTLSVMRLVDEDRLDVRHTLGHYLPKMEKTNKARLRMDMVLSHQSGLKSWIPFYKETMVGKRYPRPSAKIYRKEKVDEFTVQITDQMFMSEDYVSVVWDQLEESEVRPQGRYRYSDLGFYILADLIKEQTGQGLDEYANQIFYQYLGLKRTGFNPCNWYPVEQIVPTEEDRYFRMQRIQGHVHDMGCAMLGGVSGHAGLFSNAQDMAVIMHMLMNHGYYGGHRYLSHEVVDQFTHRMDGSSRRALGFDMKDKNPDRKSYTSPLASNQTYGHTGFTGIGVWNDPVHELTYIFFSNRTYPNSRNNLLNKEEYREQIHSIIYQSFLYRDQNTTFP